MPSRAYLEQREQDIRDGLGDYLHWAATARQEGDEDRALAEEWVTEQLLQERASFPHSDSARKAADWYAIALLRWRRGDWRAALSAVEIIIDNDGLEHLPALLRTVRDHPWEYVQDGLGVLQTRVKDALEHDEGPASEINPTFDDPPTIE